MQMHVTTLPDLFTRVPIMLVTICRLRTYTETGGLLVYITKINHHLQEGRSVRPMQRVSTNSTVPVPSREFFFHCVAACIHRPHPPQACLSQTTLFAFEDSLYRFQDPGVSDKTVEMRRGDQWIAVTNLRMRTLLEGNPHVRVHFPVFVIQLDVVLELVLCENVLQCAVAVLSEKVDVYCIAEARGI